MKKIIVVMLIIVMIAMFFVACQDVGEAALEVKPNASVSQVDGNNILTVTLLNKNGGDESLKNVASGKVSRVSISIESVKRNGPSATLDTVWVKNGSGENKDYVELVKPENTAETGYNINNFDGVWYKGYAMKFNINLTKFVAEHEDKTFINEDRFIKVIIKLTKGISAATVDFTQTYFFDMEKYEQLKDICTINTNIESYDQSVRVKDVEKFYIYKGYSINDFKDYPNILGDYNALKEHLINRRYVNDATMRIKDLSTNEYITDIANYVFTQSTTLNESVY